MPESESLSPIATSLAQVQQRIAAATQAAGRAPGSVRLLAVSSDKRVPQLPDVPTFVEAGYPDMVVESWIAVFVPKATPRPVIDKLNRAVTHAVDSEKFKDMAAKAIQQPEAGSPEDLGALLQRDIDVWRKVIAPLNLPSN